MKKHTILIIILIVATLITLIFLTINNVVVTDFESCLAAGNPALESYPRQCIDAKTGEHYVENISIGGETDEHGCLIAAGYSWNKTDQMCIREWTKKYCTPESRTADVCITLYEPVCGLPMKKTFSNSCIACLNKSVHYYVEGECL
jgi:hypothetical protein